MAGRAPLNRYGGEKISWLDSSGTTDAPAIALPLAPWSTVPSGRSSDTEWYTRMRLFAASVVHWVGFAGFQSSAVRVASPGLMSTKPPPLVPPVISTVPSGRMVELRCRRGTDIEPALVHAGDAAFR